MKRIGRNSSDVEGIGGEDHITVAVPDAGQAVVEEVARG